MNKKEYAILQDKIYDLKETNEKVIPVHKNDNYIIYMVESEAEFMNTDQWKDKVKNLLRGSGYYKTYMEAA